VKICKDKAATSAILNYNNLKCFYHQYFDRNNTITQIINYSKKYKNGVVIKPNEGSSGHQVYLCKNSNTMKAAISEILKTNYSLAISPYVSYENEYRAIILNNKILLFYQKIRRFVIGDGVSSIAQLYDKKYHEKICNKKILKKGIKYICN
jgi:glutathione synthase/RimK-type ligase-like ATP-grasp enzyme